MPDSRNGPGSGRGLSLLRSASGRALGAKLALSLVPVALFIGLWWVASSVFFQVPRIFPSPSDVFAEVIRIGAGESPFGSSYEHAAATFTRLFGALGISLVLGTALGVIAGRMSFVFELLENWVWIFLAVPSVVWVFIFVVALGISDLIPIASLSALLIPTVLINVAEGTKSVPKDILEMSDAYKATQLQRIGSIYIPYLVPYLLGSARVGFALGIKIVVIAEIVGLTRGIGYLMLYSRDLLFMAPVVAWGVILIALGLLIDYAVFAQVERRVAKWRDRAAAIGPQRFDQHVVVGA